MEVVIEIFHFQGSYSLYQFVLINHLTSNVFGGLILSCMNQFFTSVFEGC